MNWIVASIAAVLTGFGLAAKASSPKPTTLKSEPYAGESPKTPYELLFKQYGSLYGVDWRILSGIAYTESSYKTDAINFADNESIGLMQILCRPNGSGGCANKFNIDGWSQIKKIDLFDAERNIMLAAQIVSWNISTYGLRRGIAVYNEWDQHIVGPNGPFKNQAYVNKVLSRAKELGYEEKF